MKTIFNLIINPGQFVKEHNYFGADTMMCPAGWNSLNEFIDQCKKYPDYNSTISYEYDYPMYLAIGDTVTINHYDYEIIDKVVELNHNRISYTLDKI